MRHTLHIAWILLLLFRAGTGTGQDLPDTLFVLPGMDAADSAGVERLITKAEHFTGIDQDSAFEPVGIAAV